MHSISEFITGKILIYKNIAKRIILVDFLSSLAAPHPHPCNQNIVFFHIYWLAHLGNIMGPKHYSVTVVGWML